MNRRALLQGAGIALPLLASLRRTRAAEPRPRRFVNYFTPNGHPPAHWRPGGDEHTFNLSAILKPLAAHRSSLIVLDGISMASSRTTGHAGVGSALTGTRPGRGISLDQAIARAVGSTSRIPSLELGVLVGPPAHPLASPYLSYAPTLTPLKAQDDPEAVYRRLFAGTMEPERLARLLARRQSVLDSVKENLGRVRQAVDVTDRRILDAHLASVRDVERNLTTMMIARQTCSRPFAMPRVPPRTDAEATALRDLQIDLLVLALACDQTRIATLMIGAPDSALSFPYLNVKGTWSELSDRTDAASVSAHARISLWCASGLARLISALKAIPDGSQTLFDSVVVLWNTDCNPDHSHQNMPFLLAGTAGATFRTGRYVRLRSVSHNDLLLSLLQAMGVQATSFGDPEMCTGPIAALY